MISATVVQLLSPRQGCRHPHARIQLPCRMAYFRFDKMQIMLLLDGAHQIPLLELQLLCIAGSLSIVSDTLSSWKQTHPILQTTVASFERQTVSGMDCNLGQRGSFCLARFGRMSRRLVHCGVRDIHHFEAHCVKSRCWGFHRTNTSTHLSKPLGLIFVHRGPSGSRPYASHAGVSPEVTVIGADE